MAIPAIESDAIGSRNPEAEPGEVIPAPRVQTTVAGTCWWLGTCAESVVGPTAALPVTARVGGDHKGSWRN